MARKSVSRKNVKKRKSVPRKNIKKSVPRKKAVNIKRKSVVKKQKNVVKNDFYDPELVQKNLDRYAKYLNPFEDVMGETIKIGNGYHLSSKALFNLLSQQIARDKGIQIRRSMTGYNPELVRKKRFPNFNDYLKRWSKDRSIHYFDGDRFRRAFEIVIDYLSEHEDDEIEDKKAYNEFDPNYDVNPYKMLKYETVFQNMVENIIEEAIQDGKMNETNVDDLLIDLFFKLREEKWGREE